MATVEAAAHGVEVVTAGHPGDVRYRDLTEAERVEIARGWHVLPDEAAPFFDRMNAVRRWEVLCTLNGRGGPHSNGRRSDLETNGAFDELVGNRIDPLPVEDLAAMLARVDAAPAPRYLVRPVIAEGDYGMFAAEFKAGKSWAVLDLVVSVASGTAWLGLYDVERPGSVLLFAGEGGARKLARRVRAVCESRALDAGTLPVRTCLRAPHLTSEAAMALVDAEIAGTRPVLVVIDPLYLAARGARGSDLYEMGSHLEGIQAACQRHGAALLLTHHWNKTGEGRGAKRMTGVGPEAWGRVLISAAVMSRTTDRDTGGSTVVLELDFQGDEIAETTARFRRRVWTDDQGDLTSAMHYEVTALAGAETPIDPGLEGLRPAARV